MVSSADVDDARVERKVDEVYEFAEKCGETELVHMFSRKYVRGMICGEYSEAEPGSIIKRLQKADEARLEIHRLEKEMDRDLFKTLVTSGNLVRSGRDKKSGLVMFWHLANALHAKRKVRVDSPQGKAYVRAIVWTIETVTVQMMDTFGCRKPSFSICMDLYSGIVDFNPAITEHGMRLLNNAFPNQQSAYVYMFGVPRMVPWIFNHMCRMLPGMNDTLQVMKDYDDALDISEDPNDVPDFWVCDDSSPCAYAMRRTSTWCYERCLDDANRVTTKDVFNPGPWPYHDNEKVEHSSVAVADKKPTGLEAIVEDDDDEDEEDGW